MVESDTRTEFSPFVCALVLADVLGVSHPSMPEINGRVLPNDAVLRVTHEYIKNALSGYYGNPDTLRVISETMGVLQIMRRWGIISWESIDIRGTNAVLGVGNRLQNWENAFIHLLNGEVEVEDRARIIQMSMYFQVLSQVEIGIYDKQKLFRGN